MANKSLPFAPKSKSKSPANKKMSRSDLKKAGAPGPFSPKKKMSSGGCLNCGGRVKK